MIEESSRNMPGAFPLTEDFADEDEEDLIQKDINAIIDEERM